MLDNKGSIFVSVNSFSSQEVVRRKRSPGTLETKIRSGTQRDLSGTFHWKGKFPVVEIFQDFYNFYIFWTFFYLMGITIAGGEDFYIVQRCCSLFFLFVIHQKESARRNGNRSGAKKVQKWLKKTIFSEKIMMIIQNCHVRSVFTKNHF